ncbi:biotin/lipoyl-containing protein [Aquimarina sp. AU58]|uniref:biotin/lipoyl-containing protein n=1 Tax=Aquimarina sp. AU58 TaxID=1874112 RepID=UPI000D6E3806|nr:lipoyl domain-containing protein [Aquimarina sp. AU58]
MIKSLIQKLFTPNKKQDELIEELKAIPGFITKEEIELVGNNQIKPNKFVLKKGEILPVLLPEFGNLSNLKITKWYFQTGDLVSEGNVICEIENGKITMEFESIADGRISSICLTDKILKTGEMLCELEGI